MIINFYGSVKRYDLFTWKRMSGFIFHSSFIVMIIGAGVTRYFGYEGKMSIREGSSADYIFSDQTYLNVRANDGTKEYAVDKKLSLGMITDNSFEEEVETPNKETIEIKYKDYFKNAQQTFTEAKEGGFTMLALTISVDGHYDDVQIRD